MVVSTVAWGVVRLFAFEIPYHFLTGFSQATLQYPGTWGWKFAICMAAARHAAELVLSISHLRMTSSVIAWFIPLRMRLVSGPVDIKPRIQLRVYLDELLVPERETLMPIRTTLGLHGARSNPLMPPKAVFESFLPHPPTTMSTASTDTQGTYVANLPEETGWRDVDNSYVLQGEWVEALPEPGDTRPRSNVVLVYAHGGGFVFCSATFHRQMAARLVLEFGPGARAFVVDYRLAPEYPFPAAIHDMYAAYLYLTQPDHPAVRVVERQRHYSTATRHVPIDPKDIVLAGDSAGAGLVAAFKLYVRDYVQPSLPVKMEMPSTTVLLSGWMDITTSLPSASESPTYCYIPGVMGLNPFNREEFDRLSKFNFSVTYLCGDKHLPNERNAMGQDLFWDWYRHLAQHPLANIAFTANLEGFGDTLLQTGTFDRLRDDVRLFAHRLGHHNKDSPETQIRIEVYHDMVHVHQWFEFLPLATHALKNIASFVTNSQKKNRARLATQDCQREEHCTTTLSQHSHHDQQPRHRIRKSSSSFVMKANTVPNCDAGTEDTLHQRNGSMQPRSAGVQSLKEATANSSSSTEWIYVELNGTENHSMEGVPIEVLEACWSGPRAL
ncbi:hypothetical protein DFQ27_008246 [Actinomortierella ambigua]|uniref:Alpha/beta hydrolase fold-3 domain-containing protein n=1 Tax=Actinomortierella ambigua TaxID=1343610 RepID=A0A9P6PRN8_9FUNG|nr:hypothetical protein DFQ27_008246 [Actinomortierella ambigua]